MSKKSFILLFFLFLVNCSKFYEKNPLLVPPIEKNNLLKTNEKTK